MANTYEKFTPDEMILRDHLALDRTHLANERTLLAYVRTALAFFITGISLLKFFDTATTRVLGWIFIPASIAIIILGAVRYFQVRANMKTPAPPKSPA